MKPYSLTRRLIWIVLLIELVSALCVTAVAVVYEKHMHFRAFDVLLRGRADSILGAVQDAEDAADNVMMDGSEINVPAEDVYEVRDAGGRLVGKSSNWSESDVTGIIRFIEERRPKRNAAGSDREAFANTEIGDRAYRIIRIAGVRIVDPGDKGGGIRRDVTVYYGSPVRRVWMAVFRAAGFYATSSILVLALTGILMSWLLNRGLAPLRELAANAGRVSATSWSFDPPQSARKTRELAPLVTAMESVLGGLEESFEQQKRFVGDAAHELKTSVAVVKSSLQLLGMKRRSTEEYQAGLERCLTDCERMEAIVAQMLTLARAEESHTAESTSFRTDLSPCVYEVALALKTMAESREIPILIQADHSLVVNIEAEHFKLLCTNLLMNALQYSPPSSVITVNLKQEDDFAEVRICDHGEGIAPEDLPRIFERFFRSDRSRSRKTGGTGLGLAICKAVVDKFGGSIVIESKVMAGTTVVVRLPIADSTPVHL
jgi:signal transduction histidine kinase